MAQKRVVVIGAGIGGLTTAALLLKAGHQVTVLEAHIYPGGCAGTFYHQKFRFDAGATVVGGFAPGGPHARLAEILELTWPVEAIDPAWVVCLPDGRSITQYASPAAWREERQRVFPQSEPFWRVQEKLADISWDISSRPFPWPPQTPREAMALLTAVRPRTLWALPYLNRTVGSLTSLTDPIFKAFLDSQLLISAQAIATETAALYGAAALDLPRRGANHVRGGIGTLAQTLVDWIRAQGGEVLYRQKVTRLAVDGRRVTAVHTAKGLTLHPTHLAANLTPWALAALLGEAAPAVLRRQTEQTPPTWGAFTLYLGLIANKLPPALAASTHYQIIRHADQPLGEGNSVFVSLSDPDEANRAPTGMRTATLSTHTAVAPWHDLHRRDLPAYLARREAYTERLLTAVEAALPGFRQAITLCLPGTPLTFEYYTRRTGGMVGGFPQTSLWQARGPATPFANLWLVGDSIFPGQSTAGVTLGGMRVAAAMDAGG